MFDSINDICGVISPFDLSTYNTSSSDITQYNPYLSSDLSTQAILSLSTDSPFTKFELGLPVADIEVLNLLKIEQDDKHYYLVNYHGAEVGLEFSGEPLILHKDFEGNLESFIGSLSAQNKDISKDISRLIVSLTDLVMHQDPFEAHYVSVTVRATNNPLDNGNNWHIDPCMTQLLDPSGGKCHNNHEYGISIALLGDSTQLYSIPEQHNAEYIRDAMWPFSSKYENNFMPNTSDIVSAQFGQGFAFLAGKDAGAVHTAPMMSDGQLRLWIGIVPIFDLNHLSSTQASFESSGNERNEEKVLHEERS